MDQGDHNDETSVLDSLEDARITALPADAYYIPNFVDAAEESLLLSKITTQKSRWHTLSHRRLQTHPSPLTKSNVLLTPPTLPDWLITIPPILNRFSKLAIFDNTPHIAPNHVLINEYNPGQGIMPHEDGAAYAPVVATISLGAGIVLDVYEKKQDAVRDKPKWRIYQEPRSLLVTTGEMYTEYLHGIAEIEVDEGVEAHDEESGNGVVNWDLLGRKDTVFGGRSVRGTRVSLTYREVLKVKEVGKSLGFLQQKKK